MIKFDPTFKRRPLSPSNMASFLYNPATWYKSYFLGEKQHSPEMEFGSWVDQIIQDDPSFIPSLPRYPMMQKEMKVVFNGIYLIGRFDGLDMDNFVLADYKTGVKAWDKKRVEESIQLLFYLLLIYITEKIPPEKITCKIHWLPTKKTETGDFKTSIVFRDNPPIPFTFETKFKMSDILKFGQKINETVKEMEKYVKTYPHSII